MQKQNAISLAQRILNGETTDPRVIAAEILSDSLSPQELQVLQILGVNELDTPTVSQRIGADARPLLANLYNLGLVRSYIAERARVAGHRRPNVWRVASHIPERLVQNGKSV